MFIEYAIAFLIGSIPTAYWYAKFFHNLDIRKHGSGNIGATNSLRVLGKKAGIIVLVIDLLKGLIPVLIAKKMGFDDLHVLIIGVFAILGHIFNPFLGFKGGKGIATAFGVILGFLPIGALICFGTFVIAYLATKYVSLGSILGSIAFTIYAIIHFQGSPNIQVLSITLTLLLIYTHRSNIKKIINGTENKTR